MSIDLLKASILNRGLFNLPQLLGATFEMLSGGPAQTHIGTGGGGSSSDMPWGEKKNDSNTSRRRR